MAESIEHVVALPEGLVVSLGGEDPRRTRQILLALYSFLIDKPANTRRTYRTGIRQFLDMTGWKDARSITPTDAAQYKQWLVNRGYSNSTICQRLATLTSFFTYLLAPTDGAPILASNPFAGLDRKDVAPEPRVTPPMEWEAFDKMIKAAPTDAIGIRDRAILIFMAYTGRGRAETARLTIADLDTRTSPRRFSLTDARRKRKTWDLPDLVYEYIRAHWISSGRLSTLRPESGVFGPVKTCPLTAHLDPERPLHHDAIQRIVKHAARRAGLNVREVKVHGLRHMAARDLDATAARLEDIRHFMGSSWPSSARYLVHLRKPDQRVERDVARLQKAAVAMIGPAIDAA